MKWIPYFADYSLDGAADLNIGRPISHAKHISGDTSMGGANNAPRGVFLGGEWAGDCMLYITIASTGNSSDYIAQKKEAVLKNGVQNE